jgi:putative phosphoesterase
MVWIKGNTDEWFLEINGQWEPKSVNELKLYELFHFSKERLSEQDIEFIKKLPFSESIKLNDVSLLCVHGSPRNISEAMTSELPDYKILQMIEGVEEEVILCGHSHVSTNRKIENKMIFNPGSVGFPMDGDSRASYGILEIRDNGDIEFFINRIPYDLNENLRTAKLRKFPYLDEYEKKLKYATSRID